MDPRKWDDGWMPGRMNRRGDLCYTGGVTADGASARFESLDAVAARLEDRLKRPLPGLAAQLRMAPKPLPQTQVYSDVEDLAPKAAVLVLLYPLEDRPHLLFTRRTDRVLHHPGQISFPGGARIPPEDIRQTAVREAEEETCVRLEGLRILGDLTPLYIGRSRFCVYPVVATLPERLPFRPEPFEVAEILEVPLDRLRDPASVRSEPWIVDGRSLTVPYYEHRGDKIWGATAMMLAEFLAVLDRPDAG